LGRMNQNNSILIKNVQLNGKSTDIYIEDNIIAEIGKRMEADHTINAEGKVALPGLINTHTHSAMTLLRGYADDLKLDEWLQKKIWPFEARLNEEHVYWGSKLACLEMIKSGTTCFNDMYWHMKGTARAVEEMGIRAVLAEAFIDLFDDEMMENSIKRTEDFIRYVKNLKNSKITPALGPHAVYTVSEDGLKWISEYSRENNLLIHFHLAETKKEIRDCRGRYGKSPVKFLNEIEFLSENLISAHSIWLSESEIRILAEKNVKVSHNPVSNMKLSSGFMPYSLMRKYNLLISLGTDGCASNNNLDMFESMKIAAIGHKLVGNDPRLMTAREIFDIATINGAISLGINAGHIGEGRLADLILIDPKRPEFTPGYNLISDLVYAANGYCVDTVICDGRILMENREVRNENEIIEGVKRVVNEIIGK